MVVVDRFSKYDVFIFAPKECPAEETARLFLKYVVKYWGNLQSIISDRDLIYLAVLDRVVQASHVKVELLYKFLSSVRWTYRTH